MAFRWKNPKGGKIEKFQIIPLIFNKWKKIGNFVGISYQQLEAWGKEKEDTEDCCVAVLNRWIECTPTGYPASWSGLYEILVDCGLGQIATNLEVAINNAIKSN